MESGPGSQKTPNLQDKQVQRDSKKATKNAFYDFQRAVRDLKIAEARLQQANEDGSANGEIADFEKAFQGSLSSMLAAKDILKNAEESWGKKYVPTKPLGQEGKDGNMSKDRKPKKDRGKSPAPGAIESAGEATAGEGRHGRDREERPTKGDTNTRGKLDKPNENPEAAEGEGGKDHRKSHKEWRPKKSDGREKSPSPSSNFEVAGDKPPIGTKPESRDRSRPSHERLEKSGRRKGNQSDTRTTKEPTTMEASVRTVASLNCDELCALLLHEQGMSLPSECVDIFRRQRYNGESLLILTEDDLAAEGIKSRVHRIRITTKIEEFKKAGIPKNLLESVGSAPAITPSVKGIVASPYAPYTIKQVLSSKNGVPRTMLGWNNKKGEEAGLVFIKVCDNDVEFEKAIVNLKKFTKSSRVVKLEDFDQPSRCLVLEYLGSVSLASYLQIAEKDKSDRDSKALQLLRAVKELHDQGMAHLDLKPTNIMLAHSVISVRIIDLDCMCEEGTQGIPAITPLYCAPELAVAFDEGKLGEMSTNLSADIFSVGLILYEMFHSRQKPMFSDPILALKCLTDFARLGTPLPYKMDETQPIINKMLSRDPSQRPSIEYVIERFDNTFTYARKLSLVASKIDTLQQETKHDMQSIHNSLSQLSSDLSRHMTSLSEAMNELSIDNAATAELVTSGFASLEAAVSASSGSLTEEVRRAAQRTTNSLVHVLSEQNKFPRMLLIQPADLSVSGLIKQSIVKLGLKEHFDISFLCEQPLLAQSTPHSTQVGPQSELAQVSCTGTCFHSHKLDIFSSASVGLAQKPAIAQAIQAVIAHEVKTGAPGTTWACTRIVEHAQVAQTWHLTLVLTSEQRCEELKLTVDASQFVTVLGRGTLRHPTIPVSITGPTVRKLAPLLKLVAALLKVGSMAGNLGGVPIPCGDALLEFADNYLTMIENTVKLTPSEAVPQKLKGEAHAELQALLEKSNVVVKDRMIGSTDLRQLTTALTNQDDMQVVWLCPNHANFASSKLHWQ